MHLLAHELRIKYEAKQKDELEVYDKESWEDKWSTLIGIFGRKGQIHISFGKRVIEKNKNDAAASIDRQIAEMRVLSPYQLIGFWEVQKRVADGGKDLLSVYDSRYKDGVEMPDLLTHEIDGTLVKHRAYIRDRDAVPKKIVDAFYEGDKAFAQEALAPFVDLLYAGPFFEKLVRGSKISF